MLLDREWKIQLSDPRFEVSDWDNTGARVEGVVEAVEAVEEGDVSFLEKSDDLLLHGSHSLRLCRTKMLSVDSLLSLKLFVHLLSKLGQLVAL